MPVVGQREDAARIFPSGSNQISDAVDQYARLAGAGAGEDQHVPLLPIVGHDALLDRVSQAFDDGAPGFGGRLPADFLVPAGQPAGEEIHLVHAEIVHRQAQRVAHLSEAALGKFRHHMDLQDLPLVVKVEGREVGPGETASFLLPQADRHGRAKDCEAPVESDDLLLVQPQQGAVQQLDRVLDLAHQNQVGFDCLGQLADGGLGQQVRTAAAGRQAGEETIQQARRRFAPNPGRRFEHAPWALQLHPHRFHITFPHRKAARLPVLAAAVLGKAADQAPQPQRQGVGQPLVPQNLRGDPQMQ